ncbi:MAG: glutaredoxin family protein [Actinomycetota bacterium]|nr:glutaredoxin family protein [Actinomycetota bacterium]
MALEVKNVEGEHKKDIMIYALSTCGWCRKTKNLLQDMGVAYNYIDVDMLQGEDREEALARMKEHNPSGGFPTIVIDGTDCIVGFNQDKIKEKLEI